MFYLASLEAQSLNTEKSVLDVRDIFISTVRDSIASFTKLWQTACTESSLVHPAALSNASNEWDATVGEHGFEKVFFVDKTTDYLPLIQTCRLSQRQNWDEFCIQEKQL